MATIKQLSIFIENKSGRLHEIMELIGRANVRIIAGTVADTSEYGIFRLIASDPDKVQSVLKENNVSTQISEVFAISTNSKAGSFIENLRHFSANGVSIEYMYCFSIENHAFAIIRTNDNCAAQQVIDSYGINTLTIENLAKV
ncbi:MAG: acetolactate synthase [Tidjanibacter sp.]|nr:acetolactate synthase [Tidjanibacter sp.]